MNVLTKLTIAALSAAGIAGGVAVAQTTAAPNSADGRSDTANYGTPPGAPLKRDGSLGASPTAAAAAAPMDTTTTSTADTTVVTPAADTSSTVVAPAPAADATPQPRADRN